MKKSILTCFILAIIFSLDMNVMAQGAKSFIGTVTYSISYPPNTLAPAMAAQLPKTIEMLISGNRSKAAASFGPFHYTFIKNADAQTVTTLVERDGRKIAMTKNHEQIASELAASEASAMQMLQETKSIAGQKCKAVEVNYIDKRGQAHKATAFYSDALGTNNLNFDNQYHGINGVPLEYEMMLKGIPMKLTAISVKPGRISNKEFETPKDYEVMTEQEFKALMNKAVESK